MIAGHPSQNLGDVHFVPRLQEESLMSSIGERKLKPLASMHCTHYATRANFFVAMADANPDRRNLIVRYESGAGFSVGVPEDWSEEKLMLLIRTPWSGEYPIWEMSSRVFGIPLLAGQPSFVEGTPSWHFPQKGNAQ
jgi:hypothetical protein